MKYIATILLFFMTIALVTSGVILWKRRKETGDYSRFIWAVFSWISAFFTLTFIMRTWQETTTSDGAFFEPEHTFVPFLMQMTFFLYPLELIRPTINKVKVYALLFIPMMLLVAVGMCAGIEYTSDCSHLWGCCSIVSLFFLYHMTGGRVASTRGSSRCTHADSV